MSDMQREAVTVSNALDVIDQLIMDVSKDANMAAAVITTFDAIGAGAGVGLYLKALQDAKAEIIVECLRAYEGMPSAVGERMLPERREDMDAS